MSARTDLPAEFHMLVRVTGKRTYDTNGQDIIDILNWQLGNDSGLDASTIDPSRIEVTRVASEPYRDSRERIAVALERIATTIEKEDQP